MKLHASGEDYLETILVLQKKRGMVRSVDVARHMEVSKPSVCHAVATLRDGGFLRANGYVAVCIEPDGGCATMLFFEKWSDHYHAAMQARLLAGHDILTG